MGYYMRYITKEDGISKVELSGVITSWGSSWRIEDNSGRAPSITLFYNDHPIAEVEFNRQGDGLFDEEMEELLEFLEDAEGPQKSRVAAFLREAKATYAVRVLYGTLGLDETLDHLVHLWELLDNRHDGILQADGEGYYENGELIQAVS